MRVGMVSIATVVPAGAAGEIVTVVVLIDAGSNCVLPRNSASDEMLTPVAPELNEAPVTVIGSTVVANAPTLPSSQPASTSPPMGAQIPLPCLSTTSGANFSSQRRFVGKP